MKCFKQLSIITFCLSLFVSTLMSAQVLNKSWKNITRMQEGDWFASDVAKDIAKQVLLYQRDVGGWPKNIQMQKPLSEKEIQELKVLKSTGKGATTDNGATIQEMVYLSKMYRATKDETYKKAFLKGVDYLLAAQYDNGGWPQFYPLKKGYYTHITYNDNSMVNIMNLLKELRDNSGVYSIQPDDNTIKKIKIAFDKGVDCILKTQYKQNGVLTAWCAQHNEYTLEPAKARAYELPSLSGSESAKIVLLLMEIKNPSPEVIKAVDSAHKWFKKVMITGLREDREYNDKGKVSNKVMVKDPDAKPIWARFMTLEDNRPFFCDRDGIKKYDISEIGEERRNGYGWYVNEPKEVLKKYPKWSAKYHIKKKSKPNDEYNVVVAKDDSGDYTSIQEAINNSKSFPYKKVIINVKNGVYHEKVKVHEWNTHITLIGESKDKTIITYSDFFGKIDLGRNSTFFTPTMLVEANDFIMKNITVENAAGNVGQAIALSVVSNRVAIVNCKLLGNQDTLYASGEGKQYYKDCYIEGTTDYIFGGATALFENCEIHSKSNSYITAASTPESSEYGFVFKDCKLTANKDVTKIYLGRPWRLYAKTVFINCNLGSHILPEGWHNWKKTEAEETSFYAEYQNTGAGAITKQRVPWSHQLKKKQAKKYTIATILKEESIKNNWYENL